MKLGNQHSYLLLSIFVLNLIGCSSFYTQIQYPKEQQQPKLEWLEALNLNPSQRHDALNSLTQTNSKNDTLLRAILLSHESASAEDLKEAEQLLSNNLELVQTNSQTEDDKLRHYMLKLNRFFQAKKLEFIKLHEKIEVYQGLLKKQQFENKVLENKIEALTDIEHQINLRPNKNTQELSP